MGLVIEKQKTKEEEGKLGNKEEKIEKGIREKVKARVPWRRSDKDTRERGRKIKGRRRKENGDESGQTENGKWRERPPSEEFVDEGGRAAVIDVGGREEKKELAEDDELARKWVGEEEVETPGSGGCWSWEKKQPRYPSSRPTSLETIAEDSQAPFSFQEAILSWSLESRARATYRHCRGSPEAMLGRSAGGGGGQGRRGRPDDLGGHVLLRKEDKRIVVVPLPEEEPGGGVLDAEGEVEEEELTTKAVVPRPDVPPGARDDADGGGVTPGGEVSRLSLAAPPEEGSPPARGPEGEGADGVPKETARNETGRVHADEGVCESGNDARAGDEGADARIGEGREGVRPSDSCSLKDGGLDAEDLPGGVRSQDATAARRCGRGDPQARPTDGGEIAGGRGIAGGNVRGSRDADGRVNDALRERRVGDAEQHGDATVGNDRTIACNGHGQDDEITNADDGVGEGGRVRTPPEGGAPHNNHQHQRRPVPGKVVNGDGAAPEEGEGHQGPREVSFSIFLELEALEEEEVRQEGDRTAEGRKTCGGGGGGGASLEPQDLLEFVKAIQSLDSLNDQIVEFIFSGTDFEDDNDGSPKQREALKSSMALMRRLLVDAQSKFRKMVEDNKQLASRIDSDLQTAHQEVNLLRQELADTNRRITQLQARTGSPQPPGSPSSTTPTTSPTTTINGSSKYHSESSSNQLVEELSQLRLENEKLSARNRSLQSEVEELRRVKEAIAEEDLQLKPRINEMTIELTHAKEALSALKADRKRLKAEKFDLLNQMKQLYATLEDKEKELRDFIRNYEQRMKESDESLRHLAAERDETEREKWNILKHARDESERVVKLSAQLGLKEATVKKLQEELDMVRKQLTSVGYYSDAESVRTNGLTTPTASTPACSPLPVSTPTPTPNGRGSSADSGVRLSSDRDSTASHDGGPGTPKESPSLSPLYATPVSLRGEDQGGENNTPSGAPTPTAASINSSAISGLANSSASAGGLSRSAEQLCERLSEAADSSKGRGSFTLTRKSHKGGGTWGSISRVFARQKKRAALDASLYDGNGSDKRASWSPSSSLCASPLTEESYSEKLRLLEEAQHIPLERWKAPTVLAWLEVTLGMPQYGAMCAENVRSGKVLLELSDSELEAGLGITHPMHRKKLRLAIEELREPRLTRFPRISTLGHIWVSSEWLPDLGLPQYSETFANNLVDGRLLEALTKKELEKHLGVHRKFHQASVIHGVHLLRIVRFDRQVLAERRRQSDHIDTDPVVWTNMRWIRWARSIDLAEYADNLKDSGVHGALVVLESSFTADTMATALGIPQSKNIIRRHLATELESLVNPARQQLDEQARYAKMERRRQEKLASGGSLGRSFSRSYGTGLEKGEKDKRRSSLRGSLSRALGLRLREETAVGGTNGGESSSSGGQSPAVTTRTHVHHVPQARPRSSIMPSAAYVHHETHRRVKSIGDIETITVTPV